MTARARTVWRCQACGRASSRWVGKCPDCGEFDTFVEEAEVESRAESAGPVTAPVALAEVEPTARDRIVTGISEFDRVLGGGLVVGSLVLIGGQPGIGKSTLLLQAVEALSDDGRRSVYVCGEESPAQVKLRAERLGAVGEHAFLLPEVDITSIEAAVLSGVPDVLVIDSIQTVFDPDMSSAPGSVGQVRSCTSRLLRLAKATGVTVVVVGHVTKDGAIAGPRVLEHMVDTVLYFEGDRDHVLRVVRAVKNRFGSVSEIGVFEMGGAGLSEVASPSEALLPERDGGVPGSFIAAAMEGSRPVLVEIQALVTPSYLDMPRRLATGIDRNRVLQVLAVLERRAGIDFGGYDVYVSVVGGVRVSEPAADLPLALALASARRDESGPPRVAAFGEIGLTGEIRAVPGAEARLGEAERMGMRRTVIPAAGSAPDGDGAVPVSTLTHAVEVLARAD